MDDVQILKVILPALGDRLGNVVVVVVALVTPVKIVIVVIVVVEKMAELVVVKTTMIAAFVGAKSEEAHELVVELLKVID